MANYDNFWWICVSKYSLNKLSQINYVLFGMIIGASKIWIRISPSSCVQLSFFVSTGGKICSKASKTSLPFSVSINVSSSKGNITISMQEYNRCFDRFIQRALFTTIWTAFDISSIEIKFLIAWVFRIKIPFWFKKLRKSSVRPQSRLSVSY